MIKLISIYVELESGKNIEMEAMLSDIAPCMSNIIKAYDKNMENQDVVLELVEGEQPFDEGKGNE